jgi:hypothetical protein
MRRIEGLYKPFHQTLRGLMRRASERFGMAVLIDCHSMPSWASASAKSERMGADMILGDRYGTSCHSAFVDVAEQHLRMLGYQVQRNKPYAVVLNACPVKRDEREAQRSAEPESGPEPCEARDERQQPQAALDVLARAEADLPAHDCDPPRSASRGAFSGCSRSRTKSG